MIILTIILTICFDWVLGYLVTYNKKKQQKRDEELFIFKLEQLLKEKEYNEAMSLCRNTKGDLSAGAYVVLDSIPKLEIKIKSNFQQRLSEKMETN